MTPCACSTFLDLQECSSNSCPSYWPQFLQHSSGKFHMTTGLLPPPGPSFYSALASSSGAWPHLEPFKQLRWMICWIPIFTLPGAHRYKMNVYLLHILLTTPCILSLDFPHCVYMTELREADTNSRIRDDSRWDFGRQGTLFMLKVRTVLYKSLNGSSYNSSSWALLDSTVNGSCVLTQHGPFMWTCSVAQKMVRMKGLQLKHSTVRAKEQHSPST